jgi:murein DD-endopeptidase MepM/ murein hydrolase activator NlpD
MQHASASKPATGIGRTSSAHIGILRNAVDFIVTQNTPVLSAVDGKVTYVKDDSHVGVQILHNGTMVILPSPTQ